MQTETTKRTEQIHDEQLVDLFLTRDRAENVLKGAHATALAMADFRHGYAGRRSTYFVDTENGSREATVGDAIAKLEADPEGRNLSYRKTNAEQLEQIAAARAAVEAAADAIDEHEQAYTGWSRFFLVNSSPGHVHRTMRCSTCRPTTTFGFVTDLSGLGEDAAIKRCGPALCSVCFPDAPVDATLATLTKKQANDILEGRDYEAAAPKTYCDGSGQAPVEGTYDWRLYYKHGVCPVCRKGHGVTPSGRMRKHQA